MRHPLAEPAHASRAVVVISRRALLLGLGGTALASACSRAAGKDGVLRVGFIPNLTHAPMIAGLASGRIAARLGGTRVEARFFRAGPRVIEALLGGAIDIGSAGPAPLVLTHARHPSAFRVLTGCASGGASFVVARGAGIASPADLRGKALATAQLGSSQDIALRKFLRQSHLELSERGGDVKVHALAPSDIRVQMMRGEIHGAWLAEPWATRLVGEGAATRLVDERDLWPGRRFPTAIVIGRAGFVAARPDDAARFADAVDAEVARALEDPGATEQEAFDEITRLLTNAGPRPLFHEASAMVDFTSDPLPGGVAAFAKDAKDLGLIPEVSCEPLFRGHAEA